MDRGKEDLWCLRFGEQAKLRQEWCSTNNIHTDPVLQAPPVPDTITFDLVHCSDNHNPFLTVW